VFELAADLYNDRNIDYVTMKHPPLHKDFDDHIYMWGKDALVVTPQKPKDKWADVHGKLVIIKKIMIEVVTVPVID
jgi:hypothetical protein